MSLSDYDLVSKWDRMETRRRFVCIKNGKEEPATLEESEADFWKYGFVALKWYTWIVDIYEYEPTKVQSDLERFAEEFKQLCEKYNVYVTENGLCKMYAGKKDSQEVIYLKGDHVG